MHLCHCMSNLIKWQRQCLQAASCMTGKVLGTRQGCSAGTFFHYLLHGCLKCVSTASCRCCLFLNRFDYTGDLIDDRTLLSGCGILLTLESKGFGSLRTDIGIVTVHLTVKAHDWLILLQILFIQWQQLWQVFLLYLLLLTVGRLVAHIPTVMTSHSILTGVVFRRLLFFFQSLNHFRVDPIILRWKISQNW